MRRIVKWSFWGALGLLVLVALTTASVILFLQTDTGRNLVLDRVNRLIPGSISLAKLRFSLLTGNLEFQDLSIKDPQGDEVIGADLVSINLAWVDLLHGDLAAERVTLVNCRSVFRLDSGGGLALVSAFVYPKLENAATEPEEADGFSFPLNIVVKHLYLRDGSVTYETADGETRIGANGISVSGQANLRALSGHLSLKVAHSVVNVPGFRGDVDELGLDATLEQGVAAFGLEAKAAAGRLALEGKTDLKAAFANGFLSSPVDLDAMAYQANLNFEHMSIAELLQLKETKKLPGTVSSQISLKGQGVSPEAVSAGIKLTLEAKGMPHPEGSKSVDLSLEAEGRFDQGVAVLKQVQGRTDEASLLANGRYDLSTGETHAEVKVEAKRLQSMSSLLGLKGLGGSLILECSAAGTLERPSLKLTLQGKDLHYQDVNIGGLWLNGALDSSGILTVSKLTMKNRGSLVTGAGSFRIRQGLRKPTPPFPATFKATLQDVEATDFLPEQPVRGVVNGEVNVTGDRESLHASLSLTGRGFSWEGIQVGDLDVRAGLDKGTLRIENIEVRNGNSVLSMKGTSRVLREGSLEPTSNPSFELDASAGAIFLEDFSKSLKGKVSLRAHAEGTPQALEGSARIKGTELHIDEQKLELVDIQAELNGDRLRVDPFRITVASGEQVVCSGWLSADKAYQVRITSGAISLGNIAWIKDRGITGGRLFLDLAGKGTLGNPALAGDVKLGGMQVNGKNLEDVRIRLDLSDQVVRISGNPGFELAGSYDLGKSEFSASARFRETDLAPLFTVLERDTLGGKISGVLELSGNTRAISAAHASLDLPDLHLLFQGKEIARGEDIKINYEDERFTTPGFTVYLMDKGELAIKNRPLRSGPLDFVLEGTIPVHIVSYFVDDLPDLTGELKVSGSLGGTYSRPILQGQATIERVAFTVPVLMQRVQELKGNVRLVHGTLAFNDINGRLDSGRFSVNGRLDLHRFLPTGGVLTIKGSALPVKIPDTLDLLLNTDLKIRGTKEGMQVDGDIVLLEGLYYKDTKLSLIKGLGQRRREESLPPHKITDPFLRKIGFNVSVRSRQPLLVDNNLADLEIRPDLNLSGKLSRPVLTGRADVVSGTVTYLRKNFTVRKGVIDFVNPYKIEPTLDIKSDVKVRKWTVSLAVSGTPDHLSLELSSTPKEEDADILSLLVTGKTTSELIQGEGGTSKSTDQMLADLIASNFGEDIKKKTGLDILEVETTNEEEENTSDRIKLTVGKELSSRMTVKYAVETQSGEIVQRAISDYRLFEHILVSGFQDTKGAYGGEMIYRLEFR